MAPVSRAGGAAPRSTASADAAAERARQRAAEAARAAAEARARAEAQRQAAAAAQEKARADAEAARAARAANTQAQQARTQAQQQLQQAQSALDSKVQQLDTRGPRPGDSERLSQLQAERDAAQTRFDQASAAARDTQQAANHASRRADASQRDAITQANSALSTQRAANTAATTAGQAQPFPEANTVRDAYDAGSLDTRAQERLFGTRAAVSPEEAAHADAQAVAEAADRSPQEGAAELERQLTHNPDPAYREALAREAGPAVETILSSLRDPTTSQEDVNTIVARLANSAELAGPEAREALAGQLNGLQSGFADVLGMSARQRALDALQANTSDPKVVALGAEMASQLREANRYEAADAITQLSPQFREAAPQSAGDAALRAEVDLNTVADERGQVEEAVEQAHTDASARADEVLELAASDPSRLPPGVSVEPGATEDEATIVLRNEEGRILERTTARRDGERVELDSVQYDAQGNAARSLVVSEGPEGPATLTQAQWKESDPARPGRPPSVEDLQASRDPDVSLSQTTVRRDGDALVQSTYQQSAQNGITQTEKRYGSQDDLDGITDRLDERFDEDERVDTVSVRTTHIPPAGAEGPDGEPAKATVTESTSYSQGSVRLDGAVSRQVDSPADGRTPSREDLASAAERAEDADASPRSWTLQVSEPNELNTQTFVEGQTDLSVVTRRRVEGDTVTETTEGRVPNPDGEGDPVEIRGEATRTYNDAGQVTAAHSDQTDASGTRRVQDFTRTEARNAQGELEVTERTTSSETPREGEPRTVRAEQTAVQTELGPQLVRASQTLTGPEGEATASITPEGQSLTVNGRRMESVEQLAGLPEGEASLGALAMDGLSGQVQDFNALAQGLHNTLAEQQAAHDDGEQSAAVATSNYGLSRLKQVLTTNHAQATPGFADPSAPGAPRGSGTPRADWKQAPSVTLSPTERLAGGSTGIVQAAAGAYGIYASGRSLIQNWSQGNWMAVAQDAIGVVSGGASVYGGLNAVLTAARGSGSGLTLGGSVGTLGGRINPSVAGQVLGRVSVALGVVAGGVQVVQGIQNGNGWQIASGAVTAGAAIGGYLAVGAAAGAWGGPAGAAVGLAIGLAAFGVTKLFDYFDDSEHDIATAQI